MQAGLGKDSFLASNNDILLTTISLLFMAIIFVRDVSSKGPHSELYNDIDRFGVFYSTLLCL